MKTKPGRHQIERMRRRVTLLQALGQASLFATWMALVAATVQWFRFRDNGGWSPAAAYLIRALFAFEASLFPASLFLLTTAGARWSYTGAWAKCALSVSFMAVVTSGGFNQDLSKIHIISAVVVGLFMQTVVGLGGGALFRWRRGDFIERELDQLGAGKSRPPHELYDPQIDCES
jgi:hypothetical protein